MAEPAAGPSAPESGVLSVSVSDPVTQSEGPRSFVTFRVATTTDLAAFKWKSFSVIRRFRDFAFLHDRLSDLYPGEQCTASSHSPRRRGCSPACRFSLRISLLGRRRLLLGLALPGGDMDNPSTCLGSPVANSPHSTSRACSLHTAPQASSYPHCQRSVSPPSWCPWARSS